MSLSAGTRLGTYEILALLGKGGMGEVYRARDTQLGRDVAIKVLPPELAQDKERLARFEREAKSLAALNHPNIATIHGFDRYDDVSFLVMELVEGEDLAARIGRGPVPPDEARTLFIQIAMGLEAAHEKGFVHRDLKPENIVVTRDGRPKILDFGLAKGMNKSTPGEDLTQSPTMTANATKAGVLLGTAAYMSPEQAKGLEVDRRADIWAFGACLFEAVTGKRAFQREDIAETLAAILSGEVEWASLPRSATPALEKLIRRCLTRELRSRFHDIADVRIELESIGGDADSEAELGTPDGRPRRLMLQLAPWLLALALGSAWGLTLLTSRDPGGGLTPKSSRWTLPLPTGSRVGLTGNNGQYDYSGLVAMSPDGTKFAYSVRDAQGRANLHLRQTDGFEARLLNDTFEARAPFFSPDGQWLGFLVDMKLLKVRLSGGSPQLICELGATASFDASWSSDGESIFYATDSGLWKVAAVGGEPSQLTSPNFEDGESGHHFPRVSADGKSLFFTIAETPLSHLARLPLDSREPGKSAWETVLEDASQGVVIPGGRLVFARSGELFVQPYDAAVHRASGSPVSVVQGVATSPGLAGVVVTQFDVSSTGTLAYLPSNDRGSEDQLLWVDRSGVETLIASGPGTWVHPRLSPDGQRISVDIHSADGMRDLYVYEVQRGQLNRLTNRGSSWESEWSRDGTQLAIMAAHEAGRWSLFTVATDFSARPELLLDGSHAIPASWTPDGTGLLFHELGEWGIRQVPLAGGSAQTLMSSASHERFPRLSPSGRLIAYVGTESERREVFVRSYPELGPRIKVSIAGGGEPVWSRDESELFFRQGDEFFAVTLTQSPRLEVGLPRKLFSAIYDSAHIGHQHFDVSLNGDQLLVIKHGKGRGADEVRVTLDWFAELEGKAGI